MGDIVTRIVFDTERAKLQLGDLEVEFNSTISKISSGWGVAKAALENVVGAIRTVTEWTRAASEATASLAFSAADAEKAEAKYAATLRIRGQLTREAVESAKVYASVIQSTTPIEDDAVVSLQAKLLALRVSRAELGEATRATIGLAEVTGNLESAASTVARVLSGNTTTLERMGFSVRDTDDAIAQLSELFELAEARAETFHGRIERVNNALGDLKETAGGVIINAKGVNETIDLGIFSLQGWNFALQSVIESTSKSADSSGMLVRAITGISLVSPEIAELAQNFGVLSLALGSVASQAQIARAALAASELKPDDRETLDLSAGTSKRDILDRFGVGKEGRRTTKPKGRKRNTDVDRELSAEAATILDEGEDASVLAQQAAEKERESRIQAQDIVDQARVIELKREADHRARQVQAQLDHAARQKKATSDFYADMTGIGAAGIAAFTGSIIRGIAAGNLSVGGVLAGFLGTILGGVGQSMIALGSAALAAAYATTPIPILWPIFGGPIGVAGATGLIAAGGLLVGAGQAIGAIAGGGGGGASRGGGSSASIPTIQSPNARGTSERGIPNRFAESGASEALQYESARRDADRRRRDRQAEDRARRAPEGFSESEGASVTNINLYFRGASLETQDSIRHAVEEANRRSNEQRGIRGWAA